MIRFRMRRTSAKVFLVMAVLVFGIFIKIGYAYLSRDLSIDGLTLLPKNTWDVHFVENSIVETDNLDSCLGGDDCSRITQHATIGQDGVSVSFGVEFHVIGDYYEFTVDVINDGTIDAMLNEVIKEGLNGNTDYLDFTVTYSDEMPMSQYDKLSKDGGIETLKVKVTFVGKPLEDVNANLGITVNYVQADDNAVQRPKNYLKVMNRLGLTAFDNSYDIYKDEVEKIYTMKTLELPSELQDEIIESWDVSAKSNSSIMAYALDADSNSKYEIYLGATGGVKANPNSAMLFRNYYDVTDIDVTNLITDDVEDMSSMFMNCQKLINLIGEETMNVRKVTNMSSMFSGCSSLTSLNLSNFNTSNVTDMMSMFSGCSSLTSLDLSSFNTSNVTNMYYMFSSCSKLTSINLSSFNTSQVTNMYFMFNSCSKLKSIDISNFDMSKVTNTFAMFNACGALQNIVMPNNYTRIEDFMFNHNSSYNQESFTIPKTVTIVGNSHIFYNFGNTNFKKFIVEEGSTTLKTIDDILYTYDGTKLISIPNGKTFSDNTYVMPDSVTTLNTMSFNRTKKIDKVVISDNLVIDRYYDDTSSGDGDPVKGNRLNTGIYVYTSIKEYEAKSTNNNYSSYGGCIYNKAGTELIAVPVKYTGVLNIKDGATTIGQEAFWVQRVNQITNITEINIPASVTTIEANQLTTLNKLITNGVVINIDSNNASYEISNNKIVAK